MQVISVERWTFWSAVAACWVGLLSPTAAPNGVLVAGGTTWNLFATFLTLALILTLVSVALGGTRDPSVRRLAASRSP
jgi:hypothetical protein